MNTAAMYGIDHGFAIGGESAQDCLAIANGPLTDKLAGRIENLNAPAAVFADIHPSRAIDGDTACVSKHAGTDSFATKPEQLGCEAVGALLLRCILWRIGPGGDGVIRITNRAANRVKCRRQYSEGSEPDHD